MNVGIPYHACQYWRRLDISRMRKDRPTVFQRKYFDSKLSSDRKIFFFYLNNGALLRSEPVIFPFVMPFILSYSHRKVWHSGESYRINPKEIPTGMCWESVYSENYTILLFPRRKKISSAHQTPMNSLWHEIHNRVVKFSVRCSQ